MQKNLEGIAMNTMPTTSVGRGIDVKFACSIDVSTRSYPREDQFEIFKNAHAGVADLTFCKSADGSFPARLMVWTLGSMVIVSTMLPGAGHAHEWRHLKKPALDNWYLWLPRRSVDQSVGARTMPHLHCLAKPFHAMVEDEGACAIYLPSEGFVSTSILECLLDKYVQGALGHLLTDYLMLLVRSLPHMTVAEVPYVVEATRNLVVACLAPSPDRVVGAQRPIAAVVLERAKRMITSRLVDRSLTPEAICREMGISRSRLYRLFEPLGGVAAYIRHQRLVRTRTVISSIEDVRPISRIAEEWGFDDPSAFSRAFRHEFGMTPKEAREMGWTGAAVDVHRERFREEASTTLRQLLQRVA
ncbi:helix-turn-helix domain-containing protein (plasmid) [Sinorhizobium meliloti]|uniref:helix-turn-helix domain-containing protein n=1 Tax=Rhizobium meliloti TaxID=382 RepID=UPI001F1629B7|nr:helix-turn-helix domain-containing protein [Sinorhizobium meliloti]